MIKTTVRKVFVVRHGQSEGNAQKRISGQLNPSLTFKGKQQARWLAEVLRGEKLTAIYSSPLVRAVDTAKPTALQHKLNIQTRDEFKEIHLGILQGRYRDERDPEAKKLWKTWQQNKVSGKVPDGESFVDLEQRVTPCLERVLTENSEGVLLIVAHRSVVRVMLGKLMGWPRDVYLPLDIHNQFLYSVMPGQEPVLNTVRFDKVTEGEKGRHYAGFRS